MTLLTEKAAKFGATLMTGPDGDGSQVRFASGRAIGPLDDPPDPFTGATAADTPKRCTGRETLLK